MVSYPRTRTLESIQIIGHSSSITRLKARIPRLSADTGPLVIIGEAGVGKTLLAKAIHARSPRRSSKLYSVNFSILTEREQRVALLGGCPPELQTTRRGCLEPASTVILKHIHYAIPFLQERLAEVLAKKRIARLGSDNAELVLSRPIFTLPQSLSSLYRKGRITEPLFLRLREYEHVTVPPLRERKEDIPVLIEHFANQFLDRWNVLGPARAEATRTIKSGGRIEAGFLRLLRKQRWEQNVIQLKAYIRNVLLLNHLGSVQERENLEVMKMILMAEEGSEFSLRRSLSVIEERIIARALAKNDGHESKTAQLLGISDRSFRRKTDS